MVLVINDPFTETETTIIVPSPVVVEEEVSIVIEGAITPLTIAEVVAAEETVSCAADDCECMNSCVVNCQEYEAISNAGGLSIPVC